MLQNTPARASAFSRLLAWSADGGMVLALTAACIAATLHLADVRYAFDFVRDTAPLWCALLALLCVAWSFFFTAVAGRTPGMALAGHRLRTLQGDALTPVTALLRAVLALTSAALGLYGFVLGLLDSRGQTLHDKLCGCVAIVD
jgi:uncharacterized RDD family membrane protein YckC